MGYTHPPYNVRGRTIYPIHEYLLLYFSGSVTSILIKSPWFDPAHRCRHRPYVLTFQNLNLTSSFSSHHNPSPPPEMDVKPLSLSHSHMNVKEVQ